MKNSRWLASNISWLARRGGFACLLGLGTGAFAQDPSTPNGSNAAQASPVIQFSVVETKTVQEGNRTVVYNRVLPPQLPVGSWTTANSPAVSLSPADAQAFQQAIAQQLPPPKPSETLCVSAIVFDHQITQFSWTKGGVTYQGYSNIDFNLFNGMLQVDSADTSYMVFLSVANCSSRPTVQGPGTLPQTPTPVPSIPSLPPLSPTGSDFVVVSTDGTTPPDAALASIYALHDYFDANRAALIATQAGQAAQAQWNKEHPPVPQNNTVINYWPIKSAVYGSGNN